MNAPDNNLTDLHQLSVAAHHEAGHKIMLEHFGCFGDAVVWRNPNPNPAENTWFGHCRFLCPLLQREQSKSLRRLAGKLPEEMRSSMDLRPVKLPKHWALLIGVAGLVAEQIFDGIDDPRWAAERIHEEIQSGWASDTDLRGMGIGDIYDYDVALITRGIRRAYSLLLKDWDLVQKEAESLIMCAVENANVER